MRKTYKIADALPRFENHAAQEIKHTTCYMCACRCGVRITMENGKIRFVQGNPNHPVNRGVLCGKGNAAIMKQYSPAKLRAPMMRKFGGERGKGEFVEISWEKAIGILADRLAKIRADNPNKLAFFTGRDQMQALTGLWAEQFGTLNWASHGGFCSVNMAAAGLMTTGFSFWEFGEPDWQRAKYFMLWGVAEDHASNPIKLGLAELKSRGAKIVAINPIRTGYQAIADEWVAIRPGSDGMLALSIAHVLLSRRLIDEEFLIRYTNATWLVICNPGEKDDGLFMRDANGNPLSWDLEKHMPHSAKDAEFAPALFGEFNIDSKKTKTAMTLYAEKILADNYAPIRAADICGVSASDIERIALEMAAVAFDNPIKVNDAWTDSFGRKHNCFVGRPIAMHAMRGISAHSNGFQTCRAIHLLQMLLGAIDSPGSHLAKPPYPKHPPCTPPPAKKSEAGFSLPSSPLGIPKSPSDLAVDKDGNPLRIDKAFSWDAPLAAHGMMHMVIANAANGDPYPIDTLMIFMSNLAWNSSMNTSETMKMLTAKNKDGEYKIPFIVTVDAFHSEMVNFSDLILPDTTYLERYDVMSLLDRPISEAHAVCDAIRAPVIAPEFNTRPWQEVMIELAARLKFPAFINERGDAKFRDYRDFIINYEKSPGIGFLAGWRNGDGQANLRGEPNPKQWERYIENECFFRKELPPSSRYYRFANRDYLRLAKAAGWIADDSPITLELYSESLQRFRLAGFGHGEDTPPHEYQRLRLREFFEPLPFWRPPLEHQIEGAEEYPFFAVTQRPMFMYHSWDSQNAWLRQIADRNPIFINRARADELNIADGDWVWIISRMGKIAAQIKCMDGVEKNTVWTWNAIAKYPGAWGLSADAHESTEGFLMNHLIGETLPTTNGDSSPANSDPVTGQAAWYDLRVSIKKMTAKEIAANAPSSPVKFLNGESPSQLRYATHAAVNLRRPLRDVIMKG